MAAPKPSKFGTRDHAVQHLAVELGHAHDDITYQFSILMVEFEGLSRATAHLGDASSNDVLRTVMGILKQDLGAHDLCYRLGGDEFLLIFPTKGEPDCLDLVERLGRGWTRAASTCEAEIDVSIGFASSSASAQGSTIEGLFAAADVTMHTIGPETALRNHDLASAGVREKRPSLISVFAHRIGVFAEA